MKKSIIALFISLLVISVNARSHKEPIQTKYYLGLGSGINAHTGLFGLTGEYRLIDKTFLQGAVGLSTWGIKTSFGFRYDFRFINTIGIGMNYTHASGIQYMTLNTTQNGNQESYVIDCHPSNTLDLKVAYNYNVGKRSKFFAETGYAIPLNYEPYKIVEGPAPDEFAKNLLRIFQPGGVILVVGLSIGLGQGF